MLRLRHKISQGYPDDTEFIEFYQIDLKRHFDTYISLSSGSSKAITCTKIDRTEFQDENMVPAKDANLLN